MEINRLYKICRLCVCAAIPPIAGILLDLIGKIAILAVGIEEC